jgi:hypothetical protein
MTNQDQEIAQLKADNAELQECFNEQNTAHAKAILENERVRQQAIEELRIAIASIRPHESDQSLQWYKGFAAGRAAAENVCALVKEEAPHESKT